MTKVTVVIPCYNTGKYIGETLASILAQDYREYEIIVVNDGSTDSFTIDKLAIYAKHPRISILDQENQGLSAARNSGIAKAQSPYILIIDADDYIAPNFMSLSMEVLSNQSKVGVVTSYARQIHVLRPPILPSGKGFAHALLQNPSLSMSLFRKTCWEDTGRFDEKMTAGCEDWDFWIRVCKNWQIHVIPQYLFYYRITAASMYQSLTAPHKLLILRYIYTKHREAYARYFPSLLWIMVRILCKSPYLLPKLPYQFVLACRDHVPYAYSILKFCYRYVLLPIYFLFRYTRNQLFGEPLESHFKHILKE